MIIYTVMQHYYELSNEFKNAIFENGHSLCMTIAKDSNYQKFLYEAWRIHFDNFCGDVFIGIQNDLIIEPDSIAELLKCLNSCDIALYSNMDIYTLEQPNCGFFAVNLSVIESMLLPYIENGCCLCSWIKEAISKSFLVKYATKKILKTFPPKVQ